MRCPTSGPGKSHNSSCCLTSTNFTWSSLSFDFTPGRRLLYQYRLEGLDRDWSAPSEHRLVDYAHLGPGTYRFQAVR